jgi:hypothetical protein
MSENDFNPLTFLSPYEVAKDRFLHEYHR